MARATLKGQVRASRALQIHFRLQVVQRVEQNHLFKITTRIKPVFNPRSLLAWIGDSIKVPIYWSYRYQDVALEEH